MQKWQHPGGKLRELGAESLTDAELLAILISTGTTGKPAEKLAQEILDKFGSFKGMANQPLEKFFNSKDSVIGRSSRLLLPLRLPEELLIRC